jgi:tripartite-type tricarboxylate transporter receptor subunit TctC
MMSSATLDLTLVHNGRAGNRAMNRRTFLTAATAFAGSLGGFSSVVAQSNSSRPMRMIVGTPAGGAIDPYARLIAEQMAKSLGRVIIVENRPGASMNIAAHFVLNAPADGNLILIGTQGSTEINPSFSAELKWSLDDFIPLIRGVTAPLVLVAHPSVPAKALPELVAWIKKNPGKLSYSSYDAGTPSHFLGFQLNERFGLDLVHVPTRGSGPQAIDLMAGRVLLGFGHMYPMLPHISAGALKAIAVTGGTRSRFLPDVPTFAELGHAEFTASIWYGLMVRAGTPPAVVASILDAAKAAHADPNVKAKLESQGFDVSGQAGPEFVADIRTQIERWARLVKASGFKAD